MTIATGFDLGQRDEHGLSALGLPHSLVQKLSPYLGRKGMEASRFLDEHPLTVTEAEAGLIDVAVKRVHVRDLRARYAASAQNTNRVDFLTLPAEAQTVIASVAFQYGTNLAVATPRFWRAVSARDWSEAVRILNNFGDRYPTRRKKEAELLAGAAAMRLASSVAVLATLFIAAGAGTPRTVASQHVFNGELARAFRSYEAVMATRRAPVHFASGRTVDNCTAYLEERQRSVLGDEISDRTTAREYVVCDVLDLLRSARQVDGARVPSGPAGREIAERLDLRSFASSLAQRIDDAEPVLLAVPGLSPVVQGFSVTSDTEDWYHSFEVVASADFTGDGLEDWLVLLVDEARAGWYRDYSVLVVADVSQPRLLRAVLQR